MLDAAHRWCLRGSSNQHKAGLAWHSQGHTSAISSRTRVSSKHRPEPEPTPEATDEQLLRQLNSSHLWLPDESDDFGLDDVAAHVAAHNNARVLDFSPGRAKAKRKAGRQPPPPSTLSELDPARDRLPDWVEDLRADGFDVLGRNGELFLQRGGVQEQQEQQQASSSTSSGSTKASWAQSPPPAVAGAAAARSGTPSAQQHAAAPVSERSLAVRLEFDPLVWQHPQTGSQQEADSNSSPGIAWYAQPAGGSSSSSSSNPGRSTPAPSVSTSHRDQAAAAKARRQGVQRQLLGYNHPEQLLGFIEGCFPAWSANGCWLLDQRRPGVVPAPTPAEAAAALKGVALAGKRAAHGVVQTQGLARDRRVLGLVECLRLTSPRTPAQQDPTNSITKRLWSIAKAYWLQAGAAATAAEQQLLAATQLAATQAPCNSGTLQGGQLNGAAAGEVPSLGPLLVALQAAGLKLSRQQLAAAQSLIHSRQEDQLRQQAWVHALWGLAAIGGPLFFQQEMEALCQVAALSRWKLSPFELSDVLWALANSRHWCPLLPALEGAVMAAGGVAACTAPELITMLWSCASLSYVPTQLLAELDSKGWCVKPMSELPAAQRSNSSKQAGPPAAGKKQQRMQQQQQQQDGAGCRLAELSSSQLSALVWSLACLQQVNSVLFKEVWVEVCKRGPGFGGDVRQLVRVHQAALAVELEGSYTTTQLYCNQGTQQLLAAAAQTFKQESSRLQSKVHSTYQRSIASTLTRMRVMHVLEDNTTGYSVDITVPSLRVAIEADGPSHMSCTRAKQGHVMLGATAMKRRHLQGLGWSVLNVAYTEWDMLKSDEQRIAYMKKQLQLAVAARQGALQHG